MGRGVVVTGGGTGMGFAIARAFARDGDRVEPVRVREAALRRLTAGPPVL